MAFRIVACLAVAALVAGCGMFGGKSASGDTKTVQTTDNPYHTDPGKMDPRDFNPKIQSDSDPSTLTLMTALFGGGGNGQNNGAPGVGVNSFLWRASLDTVSFMPLASADPFGGVIITDWFSPPETPEERFKVNVYILGRELRADGLRVAVFRQNHAVDGRWIDSAVKPETG